MTTPKKPIPDGKLTVFWSGDHRTFMHRDIVFTREEMIGLRVVVEDELGARHVHFFPWVSIESYDNQVSSEQYQQEYAAWKEFETVQAATWGRKPVFAEREECAHCGVVAGTTIVEGNVR